MWLHYLLALESFSRLQLTDFIWVCGQNEGSVKVDVPEIVSSNPFLRVKSLWFSKLYTRCIKAAFSSILPFSNNINMSANSLAQIWPFLSRSITSKTRFERFELFDWPNISASSVRVSSKSPYFAFLVSVTSWLVENHSPSKESQMKTSLS